MKFRCERDLLVDALATVGRAVSARGPAMQVLSGALAELEGSTLRLTGTDLDLTITVSVGVDGGEDGRCVLPARLLSDIVRSLEPGAVSIEAGEGEATILAGRSDFDVSLLPVEDFPRLAAPEGAPVELDAATLGAGLAQVVRATSSDDARPILTGVLLSAEAGGLRLVATDSYRLAVRDLPETDVLAADQQVLVPGRALRELTRLLGGADHVELVLGERKARFTLDGVELTTQLIEGDFPDYRRLVPSDYPNELRVGREPLLDAVRRVRLLANARESTPIRIQQGADGIELEARAENVGRAHERVDGEYRGDDLTIAFNPEYLLDGLDAITTDEVRLETINESRPAVLRGVDDDDYLYLLMPVRVSV